MKDGYDKATILVVEDDQDINHLLVHILKNAGYNAVSAYSGSEAVLRMSVEEYDLLLLDLMLPGLTGEELLSEVRKKSYVPVIVISAKTTLEDKVSLLKMGADDYITKPFEKEEVLARIEARLRVHGHLPKKEEQSKSYCLRGLCMNLDDRSVTLDQQEVGLTISEFDILALLMSRTDKVFSKSEIYEKVWHGTYLGEDNTISVHISNIRAKFLKISDEEYVRTVWGIGFKIS